MLFTENPLRKVNLTDNKCIEAAAGAGGV